MKPLTLILACLLSGCATMPPSAQIEKRMRHNWPDAVVSNESDHTAKILHHARIYDAEYNTDWFGHVQIQSITLNK